MNGGAPREIPRRRDVVDGGVGSVTTSDGVGIATHELGGDGPTLVMVHAASLHGLVFAPLARHLATAFRCVSLDGRGHGDSPLPVGRELDWYGLARDVLAVVDGQAVGGGRAVVDGTALERPYGFGHSSGATALLMAEQARPGTFAAIYCFEPVIVPADPPLGRDPDSWLALQARHRRTAFASRDDAFGHYASKPPMDAMTPEALRAYVDHGFADVEGDGVELKCRPEDEATLYEMATAHDAYVRLPEVRCPVAIACGARTEGCRPERAGTHAARLPYGRTLVLDDVGHLGPLEQPERVASSVLRFFADVGATAS